MWGRNFYAIVSTETIKWGWLLIKPKQNILPRIKTDISVKTQDYTVDKAPLYDGAEFVKCALMAAENVPLNTRQTIQSDIANVLNCKGDALSFLWALSVKNAEPLDCKIPDFRNYDYLEDQVKTASE